MRGFIICNLHQSRSVSWAERVARMVAVIIAYKILVGKLEGKGPFERPRRKCEDNIKMDLKDIGCEDVN